MINTFYSTGKKETIDSLLKLNPNVWNLALSNEIGRLAQGISDIKSSDAVDFIPLSAVPKHKKLTNANMVCDH